MVGYAAFAGSGAAFLLVCAYAVASRDPRWVAVPERLFLTLFGSAPRVALGVALSLVKHPGWFAPPILALLMVFRRTRPIGLAALGATLALATAWLAAFIIAFAYTLHHTLGLACAVLAVIPAVACAWWRRCPVISVAILALGFSVGMTLSGPLNHDGAVWIPVLNVFIPFASGSLAVAGFVAWLAAKRAAPPPVTVHRLMQMWGLWAICAGSATVVGIAAWELRVRERPAIRVLDEWAYDLYVTGEPPQLVWTNRERVQVLTDPYGTTHERYVIDENSKAEYPQRIWPSPTDGFYVQGMYSVGWWKTPLGGAPIAKQPAAQFRNEAMMKDGSVWVFAEDPATRRAFTISEWRSQYAVLSLDTGDVVAKGSLSSALWPAWYVAPDLGRRLLYVSSAMDDGGLYQVDLDSLAITRKASELNLYEIVFDRERNLLWGARPLTGEVVGVDIRTFEVVHRILTGPGARDLQRDPSTGDLYTCSFLYGDVYRVEAATQKASKIGWCGRLCRNLFLDTQRDTLWVGTRDAICRIPIHESATRKP